MNNTSVKILNEEVKAFHSTEATFKKFDASFIGTGAGTSFGDGFYFANEPIDEYGKTMSVTLNVNNPYEFDYNNDDEVIKFLEDCGCDEMYFYKGIPNSDRKWSISKTLRENDKEDLSDIRHKGYDCLMIHNTPVGIKTKQTLDTEYVVWDTDKIVVDESLKESLLLEKTRQELINKSRNADNYTSKGREGQNRYTRRLKSQISNSVRDYNRIDMDAFWKGDILDFGVRVQGETNNYIVQITFENILDELQREVKANNNKLEFKCVLRALISSFNSDNVYISCSCPDWKYRMAYFATKGQYNSGEPEVRPSDITNPKDSKGAGCKHSLLVISNLDWMMKIASVINNYIKYCKDNMQRNYADYIFPKVYGVPYKKAVQLSLFDKEDKYGDGILPSDQKTLDDVIARSLHGKDEKGRWQSGNEYRFQKQEREPTNSQEEENALNLKFEREPEETDKEKNLRFTTRPQEEPQEENTEEDKEANIKFEK